MAIIIEVGRVYCLGHLTKLGVTPSMILKEFNKGNIDDLLEPKTQSQHVKKLAIPEPVQK